MLRPQKGNSGVSFNDALLNFGLWCKWGYTSCFVRKIMWKRTTKNEWKQILYFAIFVHNGRSRKANPSIFKIDKNS